MEATLQESNPIVMDDPSRKMVRTLIGASHRKLLMLDSVVDWQCGVDRANLPKLEQAAWMYGTPYWDQLTPEQKNEVLWLETSRDVSYFIWLEQALPVLYVGYVNQYHDVLTPDIREYLMIFSREEIVHTLMFRRYLEVANLPLWSHPESIPQFSQFESQLPVLHPVYGILWNLLIEWFAELNSIYQTQHEGIDPLTRSMFKEHHMEEVRHIAFAKSVVENYFAQAPGDEFKQVQAFFRKGYQFLVDEYTYMPEIARFTSFEFPIQPHETQKIAEIRQSESNRKLNEIRFRDVNEWCKRYGIID
ncbi:MAG: diiron oxygenase [Paludibacterium sp.]|uniref:diiron oxygenase n=1 Tax=Paludibacterium sp. TaxID=1917523 RepID=UPI0025D3943A|nr:diiron oxygenase [Paludibacterium sp.]MBV8048840.1 diiron oxygenase [Paludibacterium sp.]MBV8646503.1 diiron oxygenase [Paludibacterium sp.]